MRSTNGVLYKKDKILINCVMLVEKKTILKLMLNSQYYDILNEMSDGEINLIGDYIECCVGLILMYYNDDVSYYIDRMHFKPNDLKDMFIEQSLDSDEDEKRYYSTIRKLIHDLFETLPQDNYFSLNGPYDDKFRIP